MDAEKGLMATVLLFPASLFSVTTGAGGDVEDPLTVTVPWTSTSEEAWSMPLDTAWTAVTGETTTAFSAGSAVTLEGLVDPLSDPNQLFISPYHEVPTVLERDPFSAGPGDVRYYADADFDLARDSAAMVADGMRFFAEPLEHHIYLRRIQILFEREADVPTDMVTAIPVLRALADRYRVILTVSHRKALPQDNCLQIRPTDVPPHELEIGGVPPTPRYDHTRPAPAGTRPFSDADARLLAEHYTAFPEAHDVLTLLDASAAEIRDLVLACEAEDTARKFPVLFSSASHNLHTLVRLLDLPFGRAGQQRWAFIKIVRAYALVSGIGLHEALDHAFVSVNTLTRAGLTGSVDRHHILKDLTELPLVQAVRVLQTLQRFDDIPSHILSHSEKTGMLNWLANVIPAGVSLPETLAEMLAVIDILGPAGLTGEALSRFFFDVLWARGYVDFDTRVFDFVFAAVAPHELSQRCAVFMDFLNALNRGDAHFLSMAEMGDLMQVMRRDTGTQVEARLRLYTEVMGRWPLTGYPFIQQLLRSDVLISDVASESAAIVEFIARYRSFEPVLYRLSRRDATQFAARVGEAADRMMNPYAGLEDLMVLARGYLDWFREVPDEVVLWTGDEHEMLIQIALALMEFISPVTVTTPVNEADKRDRLDMVAGLGDLSAHVPAAWVNADGRYQGHSFALDRYEWRRRTDAGGDSPLLDDVAEQLLQARYRPELWEQYTETIPMRLLYPLKTFAAFLRTANEEAARRSALEHLFAVAGYLPELRPVISGLDLRDYESLRRLEGLFENGASLRRILTQEMNGEVMPTARHATIAEADIHRLVGEIRKRWAFPTEVARERALNNLLVSFLPSEIKEKLLQGALIGDADAELRRVISMTFTNQPVVRPEEIISRLLDPILTEIRAEKQKFEHVKLPSVGAKPFKIGIRPAKSIVTAEWGFTAGVCLGDDPVFWSNRSARLMAITEENSRTIIGFACAVDVLRDGRKYLMIPGIDPFQGFLDHVDADAFFAGVIDRLQMFAEVGGYDGLYLPTPDEILNGDRNILSNRAEVTNAALRAKGKRRLRVELIEPVYWNSKPKPYPIQQVMVFWERTRSR